MYTFEQAVGTNLREQLKGIVDPIRSGILFKILVIAIRKQ